MVSPSLEPREMTLVRAMRRSCGPHHFEGSPQRSRVGLGEPLGAAREPERCWSPSKPRDQGLHWMNSLFIIVFCRWQMILVFPLQRRYKYSSQNKSVETEPKGSYYIHSSCKCQRLWQGREGGSTEGFEEHWAKARAHSLQTQVLWSLLRHPFHLV